MFVSVFLHTWLYALLWGLDRPLIESDAYERRDFICSIGTLTVGSDSLLAVFEMGFMGAAGADKLEVRPELAGSKQLDYYY